MLRKHIDVSHRTFSNDENEKQVQSCLFTCAVSACASGDESPRQRSWVLRTFVLLFTTWEDAKASLFVSYANTNNGAEFTLYQYWFENKNTNNVHLQINNSINIIIQLQSFSCQSNRQQARQSTLSLSGNIFFWLILVLSGLWYSWSAGAELGGCKGGHCAPKILPGPPKVFQVSFWKSYTDHWQLPLLQDWPLQWPPQMKMSGSAPGHQV